MRHAPKPVSTSNRRRGSLYAGVLATTSIVALVGLSGLSVAVLNVKAAQRSANTTIAQQLARSAVEEGVRQLTANASWRTAYTNNVEYPGTALSLNGGTITWKYVDADGNLSNNDADAVRVYGIGRAGGAMFVESVELYPTGLGLTSLGSSLHCDGNITTASFADLKTDQFVSSNGNVNVTATPSSITGSAQAVGTVTGTVTLTKTPGLAARRMPSASTFDYYLANGTWIDFTKIPSSGGMTTIQRTVLAPTINPYGNGNAEGIYVIDCLGLNLTVQDCRILGTLVLINPGNNCTISGTVNFSPVSPNYPAILVRGNVTIDVTTWFQLDEAILATNFNPTGAPYAGVVDADLADKYPSLIKGLVYVSGQLQLPYNFAAGNRFTGTVICSTSAVNGDATFTYAKTHLDFPPPGFASGNPMVVMPGTWCRTTMP